MLLGLLKVRGLLKVTVLVAWLVYGFQAFSFLDCSDGFCVSSDFSTVFYF